MNYLIYFYITSCNACKTLIPKLEKKQEEIKVCFLNGAEHSELVKNHNIEAYPTLFYMKDNEKLNMLVGAKKIEKFLETI